MVVFSYDSECKDNDFLPYLLHAVIDKCEIGGKSFAQVPLIFFFLWHKEKFFIHSFLWYKENFSVTLFFGAKKRDKRNIHPNPSFPYMGRLNRSLPSLFH
jgi:hypothetical protein